MVEIGKINFLSIIREADHGLYLDGEELGEILLPKRYAPENSAPGDIIDVFLYLDSQDRIIATTEEPYAMVGEFAYLKVVSVSSFGAFLDWGLPKDVLVPFREQKERMQEGKSYIVYIYLDQQTNRIAASSKITKYIKKIDGWNYESGEQVDLLICNKTDMGYNAIVDDCCMGLLYQNELFQEIHEGDQLSGYISKVRDDGKLDLSLQKSGYKKIDSLSQKILDVLTENDGFIAVTDKSAPEQIYELFAMSKKNYKKAVGALYKQQLITIEPNGIRLKTL
jgi:predicted RNA-binding protein (virulence factor B family)